MSLARHALPAVLVLSLAAAAHGARPPADVPLGHWSYPMLERLTARGVLAMDLSMRPVARSDVASAVEDALDPAAAARLALTEREAWALSRLAAEFVRGEVDSPLLRAADGDASVALGLRALTQATYGGEAVGLELWPGGAPGGVTALRAPVASGSAIGCQAGSKRASLWSRGLETASGLAGGPEPGSPRGSSSDYELDAASDLDFELWGGVGDAVGFYADSQLLLGGQEGARQVRLSTRVRTWRGIAFTSERAYLKFERPHCSVVLGRRGTAWGRSRWGRLMLSGAAPTFDQLDVRFRLGALSFEAMHALIEYEAPDPGTGESVRAGAAALSALGAPAGLGDGERVYLAGHRITVARGRGSVSVGETVVYSSVLPDAAYLNPLAPYYFSQHNERADDNVLWSADFEYRLIPGLVAYGEFLVDDLQYDRSTGSPDKYGATMGGAWYGTVGGLDAEITAEYSNVRKWTYTHDVAEHAFTHDGVPIGFRLGPDADLVTTEFVLHPGVRWSLALTVERARKGEGDTAVPFDGEENPEPTFPSGVVETSARAALELGYQDLAGLAAGVGAAYRSVSNVGHVSGSDDDGWEFWAGIQFRI